MFLDRTSIQGAQTVRLVVTTDIDGWEVREETDERILRRVHHHDWHRVETDVLLFDLKASAFNRTRSTEHHWQNPR